MTVGFDWEKEDEKRHQRQLVDEHYLELQEVKKRRARNAILGFLGVLALSGAVILIRQKLYDDQLRRELEQTAVNEARALRSGDEPTYLIVQQNVQGWPTLQAALFKEYQRRSAQLVPRSEVVDSVLVDWQGHVVLREMLDGKPYHVTWFYEYINGVWKHIPPPEAYWGESQRLDGEHVSVEAHALDESQASAIQAQMEAWWATACELTDCGTDGPDPLTVRLAFQLGLKPGWSQDDPAVILAPSPHLDRVGEDGALDPVLIQTLARMSAEHWARWIVPVADDSTANVAWFHDELATYLAHEMGAAETAPLLEPLVRMSGKSAVMSLAGRLQAGKDVIPALREVTGSDPLKEPFDWGEYFATRLRAEASLVASGKADAAVELYGDPERPGSAGRPGPTVRLDGVSPASIRVDDVEQSGDITWARVTFTRLGGGVKAPRLAAFEPFRIAGDEWLHTTAQDADFGQVQEKQTAHVTLRTSELDAPLVEGLAEDLETAYTQASADLGITPEEISGLDVTITPEAASDNPWTIETPPPGPGDGPARLAITVASPHLSARPEEQSPREMVRGQIIRDMVIRMIRIRATTINPRAPLLMAIARWELGRLGVDADAFLPVTVSLSDVDSRMLERLWTRTHSGPFVLEDAIGARVLVDLVVVQRGPESIRALLANVATASSAADWLKTSLDLRLDDIHPSWSSATQVAIAGAR